MTPLGVRPTFCQEPKLEKLVGEVFLTFGEVWRDWGSREAFMQTDSASKQSLLHHCHVDDLTRTRDTMI